MNAILVLAVMIAPAPFVKVEPPGPAWLRIGEAWHGTFKDERVIFAFHAEKTFTLFDLERRKLWEGAWKVRGRIISLSINRNIFEIWEVGDGTLRSGPIMHTGVNAPPLPLLMFPIRKE